MDVRFEEVDFKMLALSSTCIGWFRDVAAGWFRDIGTGFETLGLSLKCGGGFERSRLGFEMLALRPRHHGWFEDIDTRIETSWLVDTGHSLVNGSGKGKKVRCGRTFCEPSIESPPM